MEGEIRKAIQATLKKLGVDECDFVVEHPAELEHGDYATNAALAAAKKVGTNPRELAEKIVRLIELKNTKYIETIDIAGPGFINFRLNRNFFKEKIAEVLKKGENWGHNQTMKGKTVLVEYTDPNPFKEFHVGHLFTNTVGESLARTFEASGARVIRTNYQGDVGLHVACAIWGLRELGFAGAREITPGELGKAYAHGATANKESKEAAEEIKIINKAIYERSDEVINALYDKGRAVSLEYFESIYKVIGTKFDQYFFESEAGPKGKKLVLENAETFPESDGARIFRGEDHGLHNRVFLNSEGLPTYEAKELALAKMKAEEYEYDLSVVSTAKEINEYFKVLKCAMGFVYPELAEKTEHIGHGMVRLEGGKMSSRTGDVIPALDFIRDIEDATKEKMESSGHKPSPGTERDIAIGAIKFATLRGNVLQDTVFKKEDALSFEGDSGPYLQYTHARIHSVAERAKSEKIKQSTKKAPEKPYNVERILYQFPEVVEKALEERAPHHVAQYLLELAGEFNTLYGQEKIADKSDEFAPYKLALAEAVKVTLKNGLWMLGINAPERM